MHIARFNKAIKAEQFEIEPDVDYYVEDKNLAVLTLHFPEIKIESRSVASPSSFFRDDTDPLVIAGGIGFGDAIMLTPVLRDLKKWFPNQPLLVSCPYAIGAVFENLSYVDGLLEWPLGIEDSKGYKIRFLENFMYDPFAREIHMTAVLGAKVGVGDLKDVKCDYIPTNAELEQATSNFPRVPGRKRLAIQVQASHRCRTWHADRMRALMEEMIPQGWEIYLVGAPGEFHCVEKWHIHDARKKAPSFRETCAFLTTCDVFLGPDSGYIHACGAMEIPAVGLFAVFPWRLRTANYPTVFAIQSDADCAPCWHSPTPLQPVFPKPHCQRAGYCTALYNLDLDRIVAKVKQVAR